MRLILEKYATKKVIYYGFSIILFVNFIVFPFFPKLFSGTEIPIDKILDLQFGFTTDFAYQLFDILGKSGQKAYLYFGVFVDIPYMIVYGFTYAILILFLLKKKQLYQRFSYLIFIPIFAAFFDLLENVGIISLLVNYPTKYPLICTITSFVNQLKWISAIVILVIIIALLFRKKRI